MARVSYGDKTVEHRSLAEIDRAIEALDREIAAAEGRRLVRPIRVTTDKGLRSIGRLDLFRRRSSGGPVAVRARLEGAMAKRRHRGWNRPLENVNALVASRGPRLLARSRKLVVSNGYAANACEAFAANLVGELDRLVTDVDAPFVRPALDVPKRQREPDLHHHGQRMILGEVLKERKAKRVRPRHSETLRPARSPLKLVFPTAPWPEDRAD